MSFVFTLGVLLVVTHPRAMVRAHGQIIEPLHKFATNEKHRNTVIAYFAQSMVEFRVNILTPILQFFVGLLALLSAMVAADRFFHCYTAVYWRNLTRRNALDRFNYVAVDENWENAPTVVIQLPMFNERDVAQHVIECAREIRWPRSKLLIQILDDSTCAETRMAIEEAVESCKEEGVNVAYRWRSNRTGYKAGAMFEAMDDIVDYEYVCVFDADFSPDPDFLIKTIPWIHSNLQVGFVQARWTYINSSENLLTRVQTISLNYHIRCEQFARFSAGLFFNFNGTAGFTATLEEGDVHRVGSRHPVGFKVVSQCILLWDSNVRHTSRVLLLLLFFDSHLRGLPRGGDSVLGSGVFPNVGHSEHGYVYAEWLALRDSVRFIRKRHDDSKAERHARGTFRTRRKSRMGRHHQARQMGRRASRKGEEHQAR